MRHSYIDRTRRLPATRAVLSPRSRLAPLALALPLVALLWLTIGLPIFSELSVPGAGDRRVREIDLSRAAAHGGLGGSAKAGARVLVAAEIDPALVKAIARAGLPARKRAGVRLSRAPPGSLQIGL